MVFQVLFILRQYAVNRTLEAFSDELYAKTKREYDDRQTAGLSIIEAATGDPVVSMDIDIKPVSGSRLYYFGEIGIRGFCRLRSSPTRYRSYQKGMSFAGQRI
ncbi:MAG: hypothetical protein LBI64_03365 [Coriobacteriales bacterium]|jgi:hypothetical protein|nr:hypothetical protein [Coriobacteriales bacterium]